VEDVTKKSKKKHNEGSSSEATSSNSKGKQKGAANGDEAVNGEEGRAPLQTGMLRHHSSDSSSAKSDRSQLVDLVIEDTVAEDTERVRARKEGSAGWNATEPKRFVRTYGKNTGEDIREGYEPTDDIAVVDPKVNDENEFIVGEDEDPAESEETSHWKQANVPEALLQPKYGLDGEAFENVWTGGEPSAPPRENP
jgi:hypothetical protein